MLFSANLGKEEYKRKASCHEIPGSVFNAKAILVEQGEITWQVWIIIMLSFKIHYVHST